MSRHSVLFIVRGLPGSGKSTVANQLLSSCGKNARPVREADDFFEVDGVYNFNPRLLPKAHAACQQNVEQDLIDTGVAVVANTFTARWEISPYLSIAARHSARVVVVDTFDGGMDDEQLAYWNVHGVPVNSIRAMRQRWEHDWRAGDPRAPWER